MARPSDQEGDPVNPQQQGETMEDDYHNRRTTTIRTYVLPHARSSSSQVASPTQGLSQFNELSISSMPAYSEDIYHILEEMTCIQKQAIKAQNEAMEALRAQMDSTNLTQALLPNVNALPSFLPRPTRTYFDDGDLEEELLLQLPLPNSSPLLLAIQPNPFRENYRSSSLRHAS
ncbi:hypothetical protein B0O99DRAFT_744588 [Bisporella sp. PMI_857]|nr:hypothetical protein B0O99DRAFT_744588 [Bisporella sp. PMI_857]